MSVGQTALPLAIVGSGAMMGSLVGGKLAGHAARLPILAFILLCAGIMAGVGFMASTSAELTVGFASGVALLLNSSAPVLMTLTTEIAGDSRATATGLFSTSNQIGGVGGVVGGGLIFSLSGFLSVGSFGFVTAALAAGLIWKRVCDPRSHLPPLPSHAESGPQVPEHARAILDSDEQ